MPSVPHIHLLVLHLVRVQIDQFEPDAGGIHGKGPGFAVLPVVVDWVCHPDRGLETQRPDPSAPHRCRKDPRRTSRDGRSGDSQRCHQQPHHPTVQTPADRYRIAESPANCRSRTRRAPRPVVTGTRRVNCPDSARRCLHDDVPIHGPHPFPRTPAACPRGRQQAPVGHRD